jgi:hypothetical protein
MRGPVRKGLAVLVGLAAASACVMGVEAAGHALLSGDAVFAAAAGGLGVAALMGGAVASRNGRSAAPAWTVGALLGALSLVNVFSFAHPAWFVPIAAMALLLGSWLAARMAPAPTAAA